MLDRFDVSLSIGTCRSRTFEARLVRVGPKAVISGKDFDPDTGELKKGLNDSSMVRETVRPR